MLKTGTIGLGVALLLALFLGGCGYYNPHVYSGEPRIIYMPNWQNRTNKLGIDAKVYQSLSRWFQKSEAIDLTKDKAKANYILAGEILAIDLPSVSWDGVSSSTGNKVRIFVRYVLKDLKSGTIIWEVPKKLYTEDYENAKVTTDSENQALSTIIDDMSEDIYLGVLDKIRRQSLKKEQRAPTPAPQAKPPEQKGSK